MLLSKDSKTRIEGNNRITWLLQTTLNKSIDLPNNIFIIEFEDINHKSEEPIGAYTVCNIIHMQYDCFNNVFLLTC